MKLLKSKSSLFILFYFCLFLISFFTVLAHSPDSGSCQNPGTTCSHTITTATANEYINRVYAKADPTAGTVSGQICISGGAFGSVDTVCSSFENNPQFGDGTMTLAAGPGYHNSLFWMTNSSGTGATSWEHRADIVYPPPTCSPSSQTVNTDQTATLNASGGDGSYSWSASGGSPSSGTGASFSTSYSSSGTKTVTVTSAGSLVVSCTVTVSSQWVNLNFVVKDNCGSGWPISGATVAIDRDFGNGTTRTTDGSGFANFGVNANTNIGWSVSKSGYDSKSGSVNSGGSGTTQNVTLTGGTCGTPPPTPTPTPPTGCQGDCSQFITQTVPACMRPGTSNSVSLTFKNNGTATWTAADNYRLGSQNPDNNYTWGINRVNLDSSVSPGQSKNFNFNVTAPSSQGTYNFQWRMLREGIAWFGDYTPNISVNVSNSCGGPPPPPPPPASCTDNSSATFTNPIPGTLSSGQSVNFTVRVNDSGDTRWYHGSVYQFLQQSNLSLVPSYGHLPGGVYPGDNVDWTFTLTAPSSPGTYTLNMRMIHYAGADYIKPDGTTCPGPSSNTYFGDTATRTFVVPSSTPTPTPTPTASNIRVTHPNYCVSGPAETVSWDYSDPSSSPQSAYRVQIDEEGSSFQSPEWDSGKVLCSDCRSNSTPQGLLQFNTTYKARVRVWNSSDLESNWVESGSWKTPQNAYPQVNFTWSPASPNPGNPVQFTDQTVFYDKGGGHRWNWFFGDGASLPQQNPRHTYVNTGVYNVTLTATDNKNQACSLTKPINIQKPNPIWKEVNPGG